MKTYRLGADVEADLDAIWDYIAADDIDAADRWIGKLFDAFTSLPQTPAMGHKRRDLTPLYVLFWPVGAYLVLYRVQPQGIEIVAVNQGSRDIPSFLRSRAT